MFYLQDADAKTLKDYGCAPTGSCVLHAYCLRNPSASRFSLLILMVQPPAAGKFEEACCIQEATVGAYGWNVNE